MTRTLGTSEVFTMPRKPLVITPSALADILERFCGALRKQGSNEAYQVRYDAPSEDAGVPPALAVLIRFDPRTLKAKTVTVSSEKKIAQAWIKQHS
jgi:hypothetical protein